MKNTLKLTMLLYVFALTPAFASQLEARIVSSEFRLCMGAVPGADLSFRRVVDVELIDVAIQGRKVTISIDPLGIGTYNRLVSELGIEGRRYRNDGIVVYAKIYDKDKVVVIGRRDRTEGSTNAWVYVSSEKASGAEFTAIDRIVTALHACR